MLPVVLIGNYLLDLLLEDYSSLYLTQEELRNRGSQGVVSANTFSPIGEPIEEIILYDKNFGGKVPMINQESETGCDFCFWWHALR